MTSVTGARSSGRISPYSSKLWSSKSIQSQSIVSDFVHYLNKEERQTKILNNVNTANHIEPVTASDFDSNTFVEQSDKHDECDSPHYKTLD